MVANEFEFIFIWNIFFIKVGIFFYYFRKIIIIAYQLNTMRKILKLEEALSALDGRLDRIKDCFYSGFSDYTKIMNSVLEQGAPVSYKIRTKASIVHEQVKGRLMQEFSGDDSITIDEWKGIFALKFSDDIFLRIKKLSKGGSIASYATKQHRQFLKQQQIEGFPETPTFVVAGYMTDSIWSDITGVYLACWAGNGLQWFYKIGEAGIEQGSLDFTKSEPIVPTKRVKVSASKSSKTGTGNS